MNLLLQALDETGQTAFDLHESLRPPFFHGGEAQEVELGAALLGVSAPVIIGHGRSDAKAMASGMKMAARSARSHLAERLTDDIAAAADHLASALEATAGDGGR